MCVVKSHWAQCAWFHVLGCPACECVVPCGYEWLRGHVLLTVTACLWMVVCDWVGFV